MNDFPGKEAITEGFKTLNFRAGWLWKDKTHLRKLIYEKAGLKTGIKVLLLAEDNELCGFSYEIKDLINQDGEFVDIDFRPEVTKHENGEWEIYQQYCRPYPSGYFDCVITVSWHHILELNREAKELARIVRPGGRIVMVDHGPGPRFYDLAKMDIHLELLAKYLLHFWGHRRSDNIETGLEILKNHHYKITAKDVVEAFSPYCIDVGSLHLEGIDIIYGTVREKE